MMIKSKVRAGFNLTFTVERIDLKLGDTTAPSTPPQQPRTDRAR